MHGNVPLCFGHACFKGFVALPDHWRTGYRVLRDVDRLGNVLRDAFIGSPHACTGPKPSVHTCSRSARLRPAPQVWRCNDKESPPVSQCAVSTAYFKGSANMAVVRVHIALPWAAVAAAQYAVMKYWQHRW